jgi:ribonucleoside-diphosphate reductase subunit M2
MVSSLNCLLTFCQFQAAAAIAALTFDSPTKPSKKATIKVIDDERRSISPDTVDDTEEHELPDDIEELRKKFVGEVDLPES